MTTHKETVMVSKEFIDRSAIGESAAILCSRSRIFQVAQLPSEQIEVTERKLHESNFTETFL